MSTSLAHINYPSARHFAEAIQAPSICFSDPALRDTLPAFDRLGMPLVTSGQFAYVFKLKPQQKGARPLAVRCFRNHLPDRERRYRLIDEHLDCHPLPNLGSFEFMPEGILVGGRRYPVLIMEWIEGHTLDVYIEEVIGHEAALRHLADEWLKLVGALGASAVAHGDLQHGNIIVEGGRLRLVDPDGMFVPAMAGMTASEIGHQHFQHPRRTPQFFNSDLDNFSALNIYVSLLALAARPELWAQHHDENLLFTRDDFLDPSAARLFAEINSLNPELRRWCEMLAEAASGRIEDVPRLTAQTAAPKSKLPAWMNQPLDVRISERTREVVKIDIPTGVKVQDLPAPAASPRTSQTIAAHSSVPITPPSQHVQSIFSGTPAAHSTAPSRFTAPLDRSQLLPATLHFARDMKGQHVWAVAWLVDFFVIGVFLETALGLPTFLAFIVTIGIFIFARLIYGYVRASQMLGDASPISITLRGAPPVASLPASVVTESKDSVVGSRTQSIYHRATCLWAAKISPRNRIAFASAFDAQTAGYHACKICSPTS